MTTSFSSKEALFMHLDGFSAKDKARVHEWSMRTMLFECDRCGGVLDIMDAWCGACFVAWNDYCEEHGYVKMSEWEKITAQ